jgi:DNA polymerase I-like protein with 3'-5' exonuclease and polymerase domains
MRLVVADYGQIELRVAAAIAKEQVMLEAYRTGADLHAKTAAFVLGKPLQEVGKEDRQLAKAVNFGLLYGQSANGLIKYAKTSYGVDLSVRDADKFRRLFFEAYKSIKSWHEQAWTEARNGATEVRTALGRRRLLPKASNDDWGRFTGLVNTVVQGSCADALKLAMVELAQELPSGAGIVSTVHDELIVEVPEDRAEETKLLVEKCMLRAVEQLFPGLPVAAEVKVCNNWGEK